MEPLDLSTAVVLWPRREADESRRSLRWQGSDAGRRAHYLAFLELASRFGAVDVVGEPERRTSGGAARALVLRRLGVVVVDRRRFEAMSRHPLLATYEVAEGVVRRPEPDAANVAVAPGLDLWHLDAVDAVRLHALGVRGSGIRIGMLDTGIEASHPEFTSRRGLTSAFKVVDGRAQPHDGDPRDHGTRVASVICGTSCGVAPDADLAVAILEHYTAAEFTVALELLLRAFPGGVPPDIVNFSGFVPEDGHLTTRIADASRRYCLLLAANGDAGSSDSAANYPAALSTVLGIGSLDRNGNCGASVLRGRSRGRRKPDFWCPGVDVTVGLANGRYGRQSLTSIATGVATGTLALALSQWPHRIKGSPSRRQLERVHSIYLPCAQARSRLVATRILET